MKHIAIHSAPRSGSTWLGSIFDSSPYVIYKYQPLFSYALKSALGPNSSIEEIQLFFERLQHFKDDFMDQETAKEKGIIPRFIKKNTRAVVYKEVRYHHILSNLLKKNPDLFVIGLVRNPMATMNSWLKAPREFRGDLGWSVREEWREAPSKNQKRPEEFYGFEKWKETAQIFDELAEKYPNRFYLMTYRHLLENPEKEVKRVFDFTGLELTSQTSAFIRKSTTHTVEDTYGVYREKAKDDHYKSELPEYIMNSIMTELAGTSLEKYL